MLLDSYTVYLMLGGICGLFMAWGVGANDLANAMGTSIGARAITLKHAILIAAVFEFAGALLASGDVTLTIRDELLSAASYSATPQILIHGMLASLLAAGTWLLLACSRGWPVSTTHTIIGAIVGFGIATHGVSAINWSQLCLIVLAWIITPLCSGLLANLIYRSANYLIFSTEKPLEQAKKFAPLYLFLTTTVIALITTFNGLQHVGLKLSPLSNIVLSIGVGITFTSIGFHILRHVQLPHPDKHRYHSMHIERLFGVMMVFTACSMAFAHGSNDVANAIGPLAAIVNTLGEHTQSAPIPIWLMYLGATGIVIGLATYGENVIRTIGKEITELTPSRGFAAELATATVVVLASGIGLPISTTQCLVGAVVGIGLARGMMHLNWQITRNILASWLVTIPTGAFLSIGFYYGIDFLATIV